MKFNIRDLLWLTTVCAVLILAYNDRLKTKAEFDKREAVYRDKLGAHMASYYSPDRRFILHVAKNHPELLVELHAFDAANKNNLSQGLSLNLRFDNLVYKATDLYRSDTGKAPRTFFEEESATAFGPQSK